MKSAEERAGWATHPASLCPWTTRAAAYPTVRAGGGARAVAAFPRCARTRVRVGRGGWLTPDLRAVRAALQFP
ncbi:hypothetical protein GCM10009642_18570 [Nocardiopsis metallicus]